MVVGVLNLCALLYSVWLESCPVKCSTCLIQELILYKFKLGHKAMGAGMLCKRWRCSWSQYSNQVVEEIFLWKRWRCSWSQYSKQKVGEFACAKGEGALHHSTVNRRLKEFSCAKDEGAVDHSTVNRRLKKFHSGYKNLDNQATLDRPKTRFWRHASSHRGKYWEQHSVLHILLKYCKTLD